MNCLQIFYVYLCKPKRILRYLSRIWFSKDLRLTWVCMQAKSQGIHNCWVVTFATRFFFTPLYFLFLLFFRRDASLFFCFWIVASNKCLSIFSCVSPSSSSSSDSLSYVLAVSILPELLSYFNSCLHSVVLFICCRFS